MMTYTKLLAPSDNDILPSRTRSLLVINPLASLNMKKAPPIFLQRTHPSYQILHLNRLQSPRILLILFLWNWRGKVIQATGY